MTDEKSKQLVTACGSYDGNLHEGHLNFLNEASKYGPLHVFVVPDWVIQHNKSRDPVYTQQQRAEHVLQTGIPVEVIPLTGETHEKNLELMLQRRPDIHCFGGDQETEIDIALREGMVKYGGRIVVIPRYKDHLFSTTLLYFSEKDEDAGER